MDKNQQRKFNSYKRKVRKKYPKAETKVNSDGLFYVSSGVGTILGEQFFIPPHKTVFDAWYWASRSVQIQQNFNRTHPDKSGMEFNEKKFDRVSKRNTRKNFGKK